MNQYRPFRDIRGIDDLRLASEQVGDPSHSVRLREAYYPELCGWVTLELAEDALFADGPRVLLAAIRGGAEAWRLLLTEHGYLRFEAEHPDAPATDSEVPVHAAVDGPGAVRLGLAVANYAWMLRETDYAAEAAGYSRLRLLASRSAEGPLMALGAEDGWLCPELPPVPEVLRVGMAGELEAYNCATAHEILAGGIQPADDLLPLVLGGSSFEPRWIDEQTVEVFTRPEFTRTSSYWVLLRVTDAEPAPRRLIVRTTWRGGANMTPTFFASPDRQRWRRVVPRRLSMGPGGADFAVEFDASELIGKWLASGPPFGDPEREGLLAWAREQPHTTVREIGRSVQDRPLHIIRVGARPDGDAPRGVVILCGQHSPLEIMTGRTLRPLMEAVLGDEELLAACTFYLVPTVNVDCAHFGGNGLNASQRNLNRHWFEQSQPENAAVIEMLEELRAAGQRIDLGIDMHAGGVFRNHVLMHMAEGDGATVGEGLEREQERWRDLLERHAGLRRADGRPLAQQRLRATDYLHQRCGCVAFCLEMSSCSYFDPHQGRTRAFDMESFEVLGTGIAAACRDQFCRGGAVRPDRS
ncbi:MAG: M14 family zinc carboxypeptidase [Armatimonadota bacterium]|nr:M14 family zinc carboxypeptidase [Armatimonadota bacterium]